MDTDPQARPRSALPGRSARAGSRLVIERKIHAELIERLAAKARRLRIDHGAGLAAEIVSRGRVGASATIHPRRLRPPVVILIDF